MWDFLKIDSTAPIVIYDHEDPVLSIDESGGTLISLDSKRNVILREVVNPKVVVMRIEGPMESDEE